MSTSSPVRRVPRAEDVRRPGAVFHSPLPTCRTPVWHLPRTIRDSLGKAPSRAPAASRAVCPTPAAPLYHVHGVGGARHLAAARAALAAIPRGELAHGFTRQLLDRISELSYSPDFE